MTLLRRTNGRTLPDLPSMLDDFFNKDWFNSMDTFGMERGQLPAVNIREKDDQYELEVAAPGMKKDDFNVELDNDMLIISAEQKDERKEEDSRYTRREFNYRSFNRSFQLPERLVMEDKINAEYHDGVLHITIPKSKEARTKRAKRIAIK